jgi:GNAT superfamily N-acetyltransferase
MTASSPSRRQARPSARRGGTQLLQRLLQRADESYDNVSLSVSVENPSIRLYQRLGFISVALDGASITMRRSRQERGGEAELGSGFQ